MSVPRGRRKGPFVNTVGAHGLWWWWWGGELAQAWIEELGTYLCTWRWQLQ